jgi:hypothetical protein
MLVPKGAGCFGSRCVARLCRTARIEGREVARAQRAKTDAERNARAVWEARETPGLLYANLYASS